MKETYCLPRWCTRGNKYGFPLVTGLGGDVESSQKWLTRKIAVSGNLTGSTGLQLVPFKELLYSRFLGFIVECLAKISNLNTWWKHHLLLNTYGVPSEEFTVYIFFFFFSEMKHVVNDEICLTELNFWNDNV